MSILVKRHTQVQVNLYPSPFTITNRHNSAAERTVVGVERWGGDAPNNARQQGWASLLPEHISSTKGTGDWCRGVRWRVKLKYKVLEDCWKVICILVINNKWRRIIRLDYKCKWRGIYPLIYKLTNQRVILPLPATPEVSIITHLEVVIDECPADSITYYVLVARNQLPTHVLSLAAEETMDWLTKLIDVLR